MKQKLFKTALAAICCILIALPDVETKGKQQPQKQPTALDAGYWAGDTLLPDTVADSIPALWLHIP